MLGRLRKTTRLDVGLAVVFSGLAYLVWALVAGVSRDLVRELIKTAATQANALPQLTQQVKVFFVDAGFGIDLAGLAWMIGSLVLIGLASRQKISISWGWLCAMIQAFVAAGGAMIVGYAAYAPHILQDTPLTDMTTLEQVSHISLPVVLAVAVLLWVLFLVWLLVDRARLNRRGPTLTDGLRSNVIKM